MKSKKLCSLIECCELRTNERELTIKFEFQQMKLGSNLSTSSLTANLQPLASTPSLSSPNLLTGLSDRIFERLHSYQRRPSEERFDLMIRERIVHLQRTRGRRLEKTGYSLRKRRKRGSNIES